MKCDCKYCVWEEKPKNCNNCVFRPMTIIIPRHIHEEQRRRALRSAIAKHMQAGLPILSEWVDEYNDLIPSKKVMP